MAFASLAPAQTVQRFRPAAAAAGRASARPVRPLLPRYSRATACVVRAEMRQRSPQESISTFFKKYDFTSTMMGSLLVTGYCWSRGQPPLEALTITISSTIIAVVANELFFSKEQQ